MSRALVLLSVLVMLSGCGGDPPPAAPGKPSPSPTAAVAPVMPEKAKEDSAAGAQAFVAHYLSVANNASQTGATKYLSALGAKECATCNAVIAKIAGIYRHEGMIQGGLWRVTKSVAAPIGKGRWLVTVRCTYSEQVAQASHEAKPRRTPPGVETLNFTLEHGGTWNVIRWTRS